MKQPPSIQPIQGPGPGYDPMDPIVQNLENIDSFLSFLVLKPQDMNYLNTHFEGILSLRRTLSQQIDKLADEPYLYSHSRLEILHKENEKIFFYLEGVVKTINPWKEEEFKKMVKATNESLLNFDNILTP